MRMLSFASAALTVAIIGSAVATGRDSVGAAVVQLLAFLSAVAFLLGLEPPQLVRSSWRALEQQRLQEAIRGLMTLATTRAEVAQRVLGPVAALVGARAACIYDDDGNILAQQWVPDETEGVAPVRVEEPGVVLEVWTSPYAPFFGEDELRALQTVAALTGIALDRVRLFEQEHQSRLALERANELMTNFVALAAHELRTPVTTVHGFVQTLNHLGDRLEESQKDELRLALEQQTARMAALVEQLLDLSRLGRRSGRGQAAGARPAATAGGRRRGRRGRGQSSSGRWAETSSASLSARSSPTVPSRNDPGRHGAVLGQERCDRPGSATSAPDRRRSGLCDLITARWLPSSPSGCRDRSEIAA